MSVQKPVDVYDPLEALKSVRKWLAERRISPSLSEIAEMVASLDEVIKRKERRANAQRIERKTCR